MIYFVTLNDINFLFLNDCYKAAHNQEDNRMHYIFISTLYQIFMNITIICISTLYYFFSVFIYLYQLFIKCFWTYVYDITFILNISEQIYVCQLHINVD